MPGLVPGIHAFRALRGLKTEMAGLIPGSRPGHDGALHLLTCSSHVLTLFLTADASLAIGDSVLFPEGHAREASLAAGAGHGLAEELATFWREAQAVRRACPQPQARLPPRSPARADDRQVRVACPPKRTVREGRFRLFIIIQHRAGPPLAPLLDCLPRLEPNGSGPKVLAL